MRLLTSDVVLATEIVVTAAASLFLVVSGAETVTQFVDEHVPREALGKLAGDYLMIGHVVHSVSLNAYYIFYREPFRHESREKFLLHNLHC